MANIIPLLFPEPPKNNKKKHPALEDITRVIIGSEFMILGISAEGLSYKLGKELFTKKEIAKNTYQSLIEDIHPIYKADMIGAETILSVGGLLVAIYGYKLIKNGMKSLYHRLIN